MELPPDVVQGLGQGLGVGGSALITGAVRRLFGGSVAEVGDALTRLTAWRMRNVGRVVVNADEKVGEDASGEVSARAIAAILEQASWAEDDIVVEYLGGVLAGAKTEDHRDDRAVVQTALIARLSSYALRLHYLTYAALHHHGCGQHQLRVGDATDRQSLGVAAPYATLATAFADDRPVDLWQKIQHSGRALVREGLMSTEVTLWGTPDVLPDWAKSDDQDLDTARAHMRTGDLEAGARVATFVGGATMDGTDLFLWGRGHGDQSLDYLFSADLDPLDEVSGVESTIGHPRLVSARAAVDNT